MWLQEMHLPEIIRRNREAVLKSDADPEKVYIIGIKGTGTCALAELLQKSGLAVSGSDSADVFYTDAILKELNIPYYESFEAWHIPQDAVLVIYSAAYTAESNSEMAETVRQGIPMLKYTDALGEYSSMFYSTGITGVHGKTTTTALCGTLLKSAALPASVLAGSAVSSFNNRSTWTGGGKYFVAETCEYRKHFLSFHPARIILTAVESDHQDFYPTYQSILDGFLEYIRLLPPDGILFYCADDKGASEAARTAKDEARRSGKHINFVPYGFSADGAYKIVYSRCGDGRTVFKLAGFDREWVLKIPGEHNVLNAAAAIALTIDTYNREQESTKAEGNGILDNMAEALLNFRGSRRRSEILGEKGGVLFMDDYGHHPTAIKTTLAGLKKFYPGRRLVVSFMSHTFTRTAALLEEFAGSFADADILVLHRIYSSAREVYTGGVTGRTLYERAKERRVLNGLPEDATLYIDKPADAVLCLRSILKSGDIFLTLGAGDNFILGEQLLKLAQ